MKRFEVIVLGAGPYGLAAAAHLNAVPGLSYRIFGEPMEFWERNMPAGMFLRSSWEASQIANPNNRLTLEAFSAESALRVPCPIPLRQFVEYGRWFQRQTVSEPDRRKIKQVDSKGTGFQVTTEDGETFESRSVVVAAGIAPFASRPEEFSGIPASLASHSSQHTTFDPFRGKRVFVVGCGQSALESAALLAEAGATVEAIARQPKVHWLRWRDRLTRSGFFGRLVYSPRDVGPPGLSQLVARPDCLRLLPRGFQDWIGKRSVRPAGAAWLRKRLDRIPIRTQSRVTSAAPALGRLRLGMADGTEEIVDHLVLATGYRIDISKYAFLSRELVNRIEVYNGYPRLRSGLESSVAGLHFLGATAAWTFGPVARFVSGTYYCVPSVVRKLARNT